MMDKINEFFRFNRVDEIFYVVELDMTAYESVVDSYVGYTILKAKRNWLNPKDYDVTTEVYSEPVKEEPKKINKKNK